MAPLRSCARCTASIRPTTSFAARRRRCAAVRPRPRPPPGSPPSTPALFHATGLRRPPLSAGPAPQQGRHPTSPTTPSWPRSRSSSASLDTPAAGVRIADALSDLLDRVRLSDQAPGPGAGHGQSPTVAAVYLNWSEYLTWRDPRIKSYDQYLLLDPPAGIFASGLRDRHRRAQARLRRLPDADLPAGHDDRARPSARGLGLRTPGLLRPPPDTAAPAGPDPVPLRRGRTVSRP